MESPPLYEALVVPADLTHPLASKLPKFIVGRKWLLWLSTLTGVVAESPVRKAKVRLPPQVNSIGTTPLPIQGVAAGLYRISFFARIVTPAPVSSSLQVVISYISGGIAQTDTSAAMVGNTTATHQFGTLVIRVDADTPISFSTIYASDTPNAMAYELDIVAEEIALDTT